MPDIAPRHALFVLEDGVITSLAANAAFVAEFPFLKTVAQAPKGRSGCRACGATNRQRSSTFQAVKHAIVGLSSAKKLQLKKMLDAHQVRVVYQGAQGKVVHHTF